MAASKMGKKYLPFCDSFLRNPFLRRLLDQKLSFFAVFFFAFWGLVMIHFVATARNREYLGLWDCRPFLHMHTTVDQLDSGIAVHSTDKHQKAWPPPPQPPTPNRGKFSNKSGQQNRDHFQLGVYNSLQLQKLFHSCHFLLRNPFLCKA